ncbi:MAG: hypothetical protein ACOCV9_07495 [Marinilabiliaceae bacterium]
MNRATISADIVSYTSLADEDKREIERKTRELLGQLSQKYREEGFYGRMVQGDYLECAMFSPEIGLRVALIIKTFMKSIALIRPDHSDKRYKYFREHGVRIALAVAPLKLIDRENGIIDGDAIYQSGRTIKGYSTSGKQKIVIKNTMFFCSNDTNEQEKYDAIIALLDVLIARCSGKQCEVLFYKLLGFTEKEISELLGKYQSTISQHSTAAGWQSIEKSVNYFEKNIV